MNNTPTSFTKILNGINTTLNIANKAIPLVNQAKPIFNTVNKTYKNIKSNGKDLNNLIKLMKVKTAIKKDIKLNQKSYTNSSITISNTKTYSNINNPTFFI